MIKPYYHKEGEHTLNLFRKTGFAADWNLTQTTSDSQMKMTDLPPFLRTLLVTDGTVTKNLEAYFWEPVKVETLIQSEKQAEQSIPWLDAAQDESLLTRTVKLVGQHSQSLFATAYSLIRPAMIPENFRAQLISGKIGIGVLIRESGMESYREVMEIGFCDGIESSNPLINEPHAFRTYRIVLARQPAILITEHFPLARYQD